MASSLARPPALRMSGIAFCQTRELRRVKTGVPYNLDDCDSTMALGCCPDPFDAAG